MKKYFLFFFFLSCFWLQSFSQPNAGTRIDSIRVDSLKKMLPLLRDSARVDLLNLISIRMQYSGPVGAFAHKDDSIRFYSSKAYEEATRIGYKSGFAMALIVLSGFEAYENKSFTDTATKERNILKGIELAKEANNSEVLGWGYCYLPSVQNDFEKRVDCYKKSIGYFLKAGDTLHAAEVTNWLCVEYLGLGDYEKAYDFGKKSVELSKKSETDILYWHQFLIQFSLEDMSEIYSAAGDYESALNYLSEANQYGTIYNTNWLMNADIADLFCKMRQYDSALVYWNKWRNDIYWSSSGLGHKAWGNSIRGKIYLANKEYDKAIEIFRNCSDTAMKYGKPGNPPSIDYLLLLGQAHDEKEDYVAALGYAKKGCRLAEEKNGRPQMMAGYQVLSSVYHHLGNNDSAYEYLTKYNAIKDSVQSKQFLLRIYSSKKDAEDQKKQARILLLNKDNQIKDAQLKQASTTKKFLIGGLFVLFISGILFYRSITLKRKNEKLQREQLEHKLTVQQLESEKTQAELQQQAAELEMQALRAQMNPHFIFNCLSSINRIILKNETQTASDYLTRFSRLIRMVLINSQKSMIALEDELHMLRLYLDMERLRFKDSFDYRIIFANTIDEGAVFIPPLLLQPFCENAIWHGLMQKDSHGHLTIELSMQEKVLQCVIEDDGIGREAAETLKSKSAEKQKSMGLQITAQRLALLSQSGQVKSFYSIEDRRDEENNISGTRIMLKIYYKEMAEQIV
jgi:anti-sigma regulatory factor (Ser/Thr protein kinase)